VKKTNAITISIWICSQLLNNWKQYICDCVKISRFFCWLCPSYILNEIVKLLNCSTSCFYFISYWWDILFLIIIISTCQFLGLFTKMHKSNTFKLVIIIIEIKLILLLKKSEENKCHYNKHMNLQPAPKQLKTIYMWLC
jgi:uncharacterized membrane protein YkvI